MNQADIKYVSNQQEETIDVIFPLDLWRDLESERETAYLLKSKTMKCDLLKADNCQSRILFEEVHEKLGT